MTHTDTLNTRDIGFLLRDLLEDHGDKGIDHITEDDENEGEPEGDHVDVEVACVDISDINNPIICLSNGQRFTIRIIAGER